MNLGKKLVNEKVLSYVVYMVLRVCCVLFFHFFFLAITCWIVTYVNTYLQDNQNVLVWYEGHLATITTLPNWKQLGSKGRNRFIAASCLFWITLPVTTDYVEISHLNLTCDWIFQSIYLRDSLLYLFRYTEFVKSLYFF